MRLTVLGAVAAAGLAACTRTEVTETTCTTVTAELPSAASGEADTTLLCDSQRYQLIYRDKYSEEPEVVTDNTW